MADEDIQQGYSYRFRYRVANTNGFSEYSDTAYIFAFSKPDIPPTPAFASASDTSVTLTFQQSAHDNGVAIAGYELWIDAGDDTQSSFTEVTSYPGVFAPTHTLTVGTDGLAAPGTIYRVKFRAVNEQEVASDFSSELIFALGSRPSAPTAPLKDIPASTKDSILVYWDPLVGETLPVLGYRLYADTGHRDEPRLVFDGTNLAETVEFLYDQASNEGLALDSNLYYRFHVTAVNFNGEGSPSAVSLLQTCTTPGVMATPQITSISSTSVGVAWTAPSHDGGCPIISYHIYSDQSIDDFIEIEAASVGDKPFLTSYSIDTSSFTPGSRYRIRLGAENHVDESLSDSIGFLLADVPSQPAPPVRESDGKTLLITMQPPSSDGSSTVINYQLQLKFPGEDEWATVIGEEETYNLNLTYTLESRDLPAGEQVQARSRCQNEIGWSEYSLHSYLLMAGVPERPPPPVFVSAEATAITLAVVPSRDSNGSPILSYQLWRDSGENAEAISIQVTDFDGSTLEH